jgi:hypothetical protein
MFWSGRRNPREGLMRHFLLMPDQLDRYMAVRRGGDLTDLRRSTLTSANVVAATSMRTYLA